MGKLKASLGSQLADMDLKLLRVFKAVVDNGGITAAEDELNIATSTISNYLSDLEQRLGMRLCQRGRKGFAITEQGANVYSATQELLSAIEVFQGRIKGTKERLIGSLQLGVAEGIAAYPESKLGRVLQYFTTHAPEVYMDMHMQTAEEVPRAVLEERLAVGISYLAKPVAGLELYPLHQENVLLYCAKSHPLYGVKDEDLKLADIEKQKFVETPRLKRGQELRPQAERWYYQAYAPNMEARALLLQTGNFLAYLPREYVSVMGLEHELRPLLKDRFHYVNNYYVITRKGAHLSPVVQYFLTCFDRV